MAHPDKIGRRSFITKETTGNDTVSLTTPILLVLRAFDGKKSRAELED